MPEVELAGELDCDVEDGFDGAAVLGEEVFAEVG